MTNITFPLKDGGEYLLTAAKLAEYQSNFPLMDVEQELRIARQWLLDNPERRKTERGMLRFLTGWLIRTREWRLAKAGQVQAAPQPKVLSYDDENFDPRVVIK